MTEELGPLVAALAKAHTQFEKVTRDKTVTVQTKSGGSYTFAYAPLDSLLAATVPALSANGLAIVQNIDDGTLETLLLHESGASIGGRVALPSNVDIQGLGSAITYLRRYAIQAVLGIAAEDDDDGNAATGNVVTTKIPTAERTDDGGLIGIAEVGTAKDSDFELRETPDGWALGFRLKGDGRGAIKVIARDALAQALATMKRDVVDVRVTCYGHIRDETFRPKNAKRDVVYQVLDLERIRTPDWELPAPVKPADLRGLVPNMTSGQPAEDYVRAIREADDDGIPVPPIAPGQETLPLTDDEKAAIAGDLG